MPFYGLFLNLSLALLVSVCGAVFADNDTVTYESVKELIQTKHITKIEDLLPLLPEDFRGSFTLMRKSQSAQGATAENPRVILYGKDAKCVLAFNGSSDQIGFNNLEIAQYNEETKTFDFNRIQFPAAHEKHQKVVFDESGTQCIGCHRGRPNWESYDIWPGAYGSIDDVIVKDSEEDKSLKSFASKMAAHPRYKYLIPENQSFVNERAGAAFYSYGKDFVHIPITDKYKLSTFPNFRLSFMLNRLNYERIADLLKKTPNFEAYQYLIYGSLIACDKIEDFVPTSMRASFPNSPQSYIDQTVTDTDKNFYSNIELDGNPKIYTDANGEHPKNDDKYRTVKTMVGDLRWIIEGHHGINMSDWSMAFNDKAYTFSDGEHYFRDVCMNFLPELTKIPGFKLDFISTEDRDGFMGTRAKDLKGTKRISIGSPENCALLKQASLDALTRLKDIKGGAPHSRHESNLHTVKSH